MGDAVREGLLEKSPSRSPQNFHQQVFCYPPRVGKHSTPYVGEASVKVRNAVQTLFLRRNPVDACRRLARENVCAPIGRDRLFVSTR